MRNTAPERADFEALFAAHGVPAIEYLRAHYPRFVATKRHFLETRGRTKGHRVLDIGAHWLHQSLLYAIDGFEVVALDLPFTFELENVRNLAAAHAITLVPEPDLEHARAFAAIPDSSIDIVLFTEIIEHITFNPVAMWREVHRVMKPGARIVVTTPNYYALRGRAWNWLRFLRGFGGGLPSRDILTMHTGAHHWKEFALGELLAYFRALSPDFVFTKALRLPRFDRGPASRRVPAKRMIEALVPVLRPNLHVEIELATKEHGIVVSPRW
ncbi:MAG: methyltransferase domain-containing protein [Xanthomonadales bacterium]|nr:methyltransferase domain-containing protein [Xanthomonadales bacterium]